MKAPDSHKDPTYLKISVVVAVMWTLSQRITVRLDLEKHSLLLYALLSSNKIAKQLFDRCAVFFFKDPGRVGRRGRGARTTHPLRVVKQFLCLVADCVFP